MNIITTLAYSDSDLRNQEYIDCLNINSNNEYIKSITVLSENSNVQNLITGIDVNLELTNIRPTFRTMVDYANNNFNNDEIVIITNSDIFFDDTLRYVDFDFDYAYCLTRWSKATKEAEWIHTAQECNNAIWVGACHDTWILRTPIIINDIDYVLGRLGCDSRFAYQIFEAGYLTINPSFLIKCYHLHLSNKRTREINDKKNTLCGLYAGITPNDKIEYIKDNLFIFNGKIINKKFQFSSHYDYIFSKKKVPFRY
jgi:hypothetical protein